MNWVFNGKIDLKKGEKYKKEKGDEITLNYVVIKVKNKYRGDKICTFRVISEGNLWY